jgi:hypothetical protein
MLPSLFAFSARPGYVIHTTFLSDIQIAANGNTRILFECVSFAEATGLYQLAALYHHPAQVIARIKPMARLTQL